MADIVDSSTRSRMMAGIKGRNTKPEILIRQRLHRLGFRFRLHVKDLPGKPDIVLPRYHAVIFINGCFWHGHDCRLFKWPATRVDFWHRKISRNREKDKESFIELQARGWRVGIVWECALRGADKNIEYLIQELAIWICSNESFKEHRE